MLYRCPCKPFERFYRDWFLWYAGLQFRTNIKGSIQTLQLIFILPGGLLDEAAFIYQLPIKKNIDLKIILIEPCNTYSQIKSAIDVFKKKIKHKFNRSTFYIKKNLETKEIKENIPTFIFALDTDKEDYLLPLALKELSNMFTDISLLIATQFYFIDNQYHLLTFVKQDRLWIKHQIFSTKGIHSTLSIFQENQIIDYFK